MATYAIGDIQGSYEPLLRLLDKVKFDASCDQLWLAGDLVNRGPDSLAVLRFLYHIRKSVIFVLGNHDLHLLAIAAGHRPAHKFDQLTELLQAEDATKLLHWLRHGKVLHHDAQLGFSMVHAGIPPQWDLTQAAKHAQELEEVLQSNQHDDFLAHMYGNLPAQWDDALVGYDRLRLITNYFTRMRFCTKEGELELATKSGATEAPPGYAPWFAYSERKTHRDRIIFGHWAALEGVTHTANIYALDTGCAWGGSLTALRLEDQQLFSCACH